MFDSLRQQMRTAVVEHMQMLVFFNVDHSSFLLFFQDHKKTPLIKDVVQRGTTLFPVSSMKQALKLNNDENRRFFKSDTRRR